VEGTVVHEGRSGHLESRLEIEYFFLSFRHRDHSIHIEGGHVLPGPRVHTRSFDMGLTSAEGQKLEDFKRASKNIFISTLFYRV
jgi:hypothetical protein